MSDTMMLALIGAVIAGGAFLAGFAVGETTAVARADRALCESRGGVWITAPVEPGCYRIEEVGDGE